MRKQDQLQRRVLHRACALALAGVMSFAAVGTVFAEPGQPGGANLALGATATSSGNEAAQFDAAKANDGKLETRWSSGTACPQKDENTWLQLHFEKPVSLAQVKVTLETRANVDPKPSNVKGFEIQVKTDGSADWAPAATVSNVASGDGYLTDLDVVLEHKQENVTDLRLTKFDVKDGSTQWDGVSVKELECYDAVQENATPDVNHALKAAMTASTKEGGNDDLGPAKAADGDKNTRWSSGSTKPSTADWLQADFSGPTKVAQIDLAFEKRTVPVQPGNVQSFDIQYKRKADSSWTTVKHVDNVASGKGFETDVKVLLDQPIVADSIRLTNIVVKEGDQGWNGVSVREMACYSNEQTQSLDEVMKSLPDNVTIDAATDRIAVPNVPEGFEIKLNGCDFEQVIAKDGTVHHPFTDKVVKVSWELKDLKRNEVKVTGDKTYTVKGSKGEAPKAGANAKPQVVPEIQEWWAEDSAKLDVSRVTKVTYTDESLRPVVDEFVDDYEAFTGKRLEPVQGDAQANAYNFKLADPEGDSMLGGEGYSMSIKGDRIDVVAPAVTGNMYGMQTILQMTKLYEGSQFPQGEVRDYPRFPVRGFMWDVARKPISLDMMKMATRTMRYYKMNDFQAHLSDNLIFLEDYKTEEDAFANAYAAFRLESDVKNKETGKSATAEDYFITKDEMRDFIQSERALGMNIVPEIDMPAHAVAFTRAFPDLAVRGQTVETHKDGRWAIDHLDLTKPETMPFIKSIFDDYTTGSNEVFDDQTTVHIGADEFILKNGGPVYRKFFNELIPHVKDTGNTVRVWGSLSSGYLQGGEEPIPEAIEGVQMDIWNTGWANPQTMYDKGFQLINITDGPSYMVPNGSQSRGGYGDRLNIQDIYNNFDPATIGGTHLPSSDDQILGAGYAIWNDNIDTRACGLTEADEFDRFFEALPVYAENNWAPTGKEKGSLETLTGLVGKLGMGPGVNPYDEASKKGDTYAEYDFEHGLEDASANDRDLAAGEGASVKGGELVLQGGSSFVTSPLKKIAAGTELSFDIELTEPACPGDILFEADAPYGTYDIRVMDDGKLGFTRELYDYSFDYKLPVGKKVNVRIKTQSIASHKEETSLFIDGREIGKATGKFVDHGRVKKDGIDNATFAMPLERIGSKTKAIDAKIDNVRVEPAQDAPVVDEFNKADWKGKTNSWTPANGNKTEGELSYAWDNNPKSHWHSNWTKNVTDENKDGLLTATNPIFAEIDLGGTYTINQFSFTPRVDVKSGYVTEASVYVKQTKDGDWKCVADHAKFAGDASKKTVFFDEQEVCAVKFEAFDAVADNSKKKWVAVSEFDVDNEPAPSNTVYAQGMSYAAGADGGLDLASGKPAGAISGTASDADRSDSIYRSDVPVGEKVTLTAKPGKDMKFVGWFAPCSAEPLSTELTFEVTAEYNVALEARFERAGDTDPVPPAAQKHTVNFVIDGTTDSSVEVEHGQTVARPDDPVKDGFTFVGWFLNGEKYDFSAPVTNDLVLEARFKSVESGEGGNPGQTPDQKPSEEPNQKPTQKPGSNLPQTGDNSMIAIGGVFAVAVIAIIVGVVLKKRSR